MVSWCFVLYDSWVIMYPVRRCSSLIQRDLSALCLSSLGPAANPSAAVQRALSPLSLHRVSRCGDSCTGPRQLKTSRSSSSLKGEWLLSAAVTARLYSQHGVERKGNYSHTEDTNPKVTVSTLCVRAIHTKWKHGCACPTGARSRVTIFLRESFGHMIFCHFLHLNLVACLQSSLSLCLFVCHSRSNKSCFYLRVFQSSRVFFRTLHCPFSFHLFPLLYINVCVSVCMYF